MVPKSFPEAKAVCESEGSFLAHVTTLAVHANLTQTLLDKSKVFRYDLTDVCMGNGLNRPSAMGQ